MKISLSWLKEFINFDLTPSEISNKLTSIGLEVEGFTTTGADFTGVTVAEVLATEKHPNADKLVVARVSNGKEELQVVCGAANCRAGIKVALAQVGAILTDENEKKFHITKSKIRGVESFGMLCGADELGLSEQSEGILELPENAVLGTSLTDLYSDTIFDISLTPNLSHCTSVMGVARELSALLDRPFRLPSISLHNNDKSVESFHVETQDLENCPRYACRLIKNVKIGPSPDWLKRRLEQSGLRSVNNVVDITNYVLLELGHPLHAFDYDKIENGQIIVRKAKDGEVIETLDGKKRTLNRRNLVIADAAKPIAIAGVMGGSNSEVNENTQTLVLESAYFHPVSVRCTSRELNLSTDASKRSERGTDPNQIILTLNRATDLIVELAQGEPVNTPIEVCKIEFPSKIIECRLDRINRILGTTISKGEVENIFNSLQFKYTWDTRGRFLVQVPTYRTDISLEIDLIEEVARLYGYDHIAKTKTTFSSSLIPSDPLYLFEKNIRNLLIAEGLQEFLTCDLIGPLLLNVVQDESIPADAIVKVMNPTSIEQSVLRTSLLPGLLQVVKNNIDHQNLHIAGFETGRLHFKEGDSYKEPTVMGIILSGRSAPHQWDAKGRPFDFYDLKGMIENLLRELGIRAPLFKNLGIKTLHSGRQASVFVDSLEIGSFGEVHPAIQRRLDVNQRILFGEFNLKDLMQVVKPVEMIRPLVNFPGTERDWTITLQESVPYIKIINAVLAQASPILEDIFLKDIYRSEKLPQGYHNLTLRFKYRDSSKTIEIETVENVHKRLINELLKQFPEEIKIN